MNKQMRLKLSKKTKSKLPISEDEAPLKTKENLEEYLQWGDFIPADPTNCPRANHCYP